MAPLALALRGAGGELGEDRCEPVDGCRDKGFKHNPHNIS
jgi:hypothetical protein